MTVSHAKVQRPKFRYLSAAALFLVLAPVAALSAIASDSQRVAGYFCDSRENQIAFLKLRASGENEIMAANAVNKTVGKQACADYMSIEVIPGGEKVVMSDGLVFKVQSFTFLPEKEEHWAGTVFGSLDQIAEKEI